MSLTTPEPADGPAILSDVVKAHLAMAIAWSSEKNASQREARINESDPGKPNAIPIKDDRRKLFALAPAGVLALVLLLFLGLALRAGRGTERDEIEPGP